MSLKHNLNCIARRMEAWADDPMTDEDADRKRKVIKTDAAFLRKLAQDIHMKKANDTNQMTAPCASQLTQHVCELGRYFIFSNIEAAILLHEHERAQLLALAKSFEERRRWWGHTPTQYVVLERTSTPFGAEMVERAQRTDETSITHVSCLPKGIAPIAFRSVERAWGMSLEAAMTTYPSYWEGQSARYAEHFKREEGAPKGAENCVSTAIPSVEGTGEMVRQSHAPTCLADTESGRVGHQGDESNVAR